MTPQAASLLATLAANKYRWEQGEVVTEGGSPLGTSSWRGLWYDRTNGSVELCIETSASQFYADHPQYSLFNYEGCRLQADVSILAHESKLSQLRSVITDTWKSRKQFGLTFSSAKLFWQLHPPQLIISEQILTSEPLTNIPPL